MSDEKLEKFFRPRSPTFYLPGDPRSTNYVEMCLRLAFAAKGLPKHQRPNQMYLSAANFGAIVAELRAQRGAPTTSTPGYIVIDDDFKVLNAGTDDEAEVNRLNRDTPGAIDFKGRLRQFEVTASA